MVTSRLISKVTLMLMLVVSSFAQAKNGNVFLERSFWKSAPDVETVKQKIEEGNDPIAKNGNAFDGATYAILQDAPLATIEYMTSLEGNSVNKLTHDGRTYIFWAAYRSNLPVVKMLLAKGAKLDIVDTHGNSALTFAATNGVTNTEIYDVLIEGGADVKFTDHHGANALLLAAASDKDFALMNYFTGKGLDVKAKDNDGNSAFNYAARTGNIDMMEQLVKAGVEYKGLNKEGGNAMLFAARGTRNASNGIEVYKYLEKKGVKPNVVTNEGTTPLHLLAGRSEDMEVLKYFIKKGVNPNQVDADGNNALMISASRNKLMVVELFAKETKDINAVNKKGETALNNAVAGNTSEVVNFLLSEGAKTNDLTGKALIDSYRKGEDKELQAKLASIYSEDFNPSGVHADGNTLLHYAAEKDDLELTKMALNWEMDINAKNDEGNTALLIAAMKASNTEVLQFLMDNGADASIKTDFEESAYDLASENELLTEANADINFLK
ncbi:ankyrin repeat domain-containing protein [Owenweeksia hongkongensis]|uniref:ankyrin repeat domain-containing protein n=1 Tax=Owenweeksia hongkongensis TaxID=253245 RepID=UPI003A8E11F7